MIAKVNGELGEFVTPSPVGIPTPPTVDLIDGSCLYISAPIDEVDAPRVQAGLKARISLDAFPNQTFPGDGPGLGWMTFVIRPGCVPHRDW